MTDCQTAKLTEGWMGGRTDGWRSQGNANAKTSSQIVIVMIFIIIMRVDQNRDAANNI
ncbi:GD16149 [Drosophila simulans]|uniref:GD16149 n=1 Tax=Drosophila simulans TaxID=7240 RepID=B4R665_DROSI|nr:GD16149 [Drosophila simulans]